MKFGRDRIAAQRHMTVVPRKPGVRLLVLVGLILATVTAALTGYFWAVHESGLDRDHLDRLGERIRVLELELEDTRRQLADANLAREVDRQALEIQRDEMGELRGTERDLREQLGFYRRLMDAASPGQGLDVADFEVFGMAGSGAYGYRLLLSGPTKQGDWVSGSARLEVAGLTGNSEHELSLPEISDPDSYPLGYRFRYFQRLSGSMTLPEGFLPLRVKVRLFPGGQSGATVERTFNWHDALN